MKMNKFFLTKTGFIVMLSLLIAGEATAQYSQLQLKDSTQVPPWPYTLPILGKKAAAKGFNIPLPIGIMVNSFSGKSEILISDLQLGFKSNNADIPLTPVNLITFGKSTATITNINVRPDVWVFPFLDLYGIFGYTEGKTSVSITGPVAFETSAKLKGSTYGFGTTLAGGVGKYFVVGDANWAWSDLDILDKPANSNLISVRIGRSFHIKPKSVSTIAFWAGASKMNIGGSTLGKVQLSDVIPQSVWDKKDQFVQNYYDWYNSLGNTPSDIAKKQVADKVLTPIVQKIDARDGSGIISYGLSKKPAHKWNMLLGGQYQLDPHWQFRTEVGFFGGRTQGLLSANYRFGFR